MEDEWEFVLQRSPELFRQELRKRIQIVSKSTFVFPFDYRVLEGYYGYVGNDDVLIRLQKRASSIFELINLCSISFFWANIIGASGEKLVGRYRLTGAFRYFFLVFINLVGAHVFLSTLAFAYFMLTLNILPAGAALAILISGCVLLLAIRGVAKYFRRISQPERKAIKRLIAECV